MRQLWNDRQKLWITVIGLSIASILLLLCSSWLGSDEGYGLQLSSRNLPPTWDHWFGTDWLGRDMFSRTVNGLRLSIGVGILGAASSACIAAILGLSAAFFGKTVDRLISWLIDLALSVPHLVMLILIAFVVGGGTKGVIIGIMLTHWPSLARVIRAETLSLLQADYVHIARKLGRSRYWIMTRHLLPHVLSQLFIGFLLLFPHAVSHEAAITFLGLGLSPHQPAIGIILSESMRYLSTGMWWLAVFPGLGLLVTVRAFDRLGHSLQRLIDPRNARM